MTDEQALRELYDELVRSRISAAVYGGSRHTWRLQMDSQCLREDGRWKIHITCASTY